MNNRYDFLYFFDCTDANPNGDPDAGNLPRVDAETGQGLVTDVCLKRKIRNFVQTAAPEKRIYFQERTVLNTTKREAHKVVGIDPKDSKTPKRELRDQASSWMCANFYDVRTFGAVMSHDVNCGQVRGPVQISFARSVNPIVSAEHAITLCAVVSESDAKTKETDMGRKFTVPYGLYLAKGFVNPFLAEQTGFSEEDLELLFTALENAFQFDQSAARPAGSMNARKLIIFKHDSKLGSAPSHKLFEKVTVARPDETKPPRTFSDYSVTIDRQSLPQGIEIIERL
ncbi:MAG: type I-C CRISPR-associated protein Cas7/Csd2 [Verrucomicrobia bacterium]|nr:type I-C CRISPR-associated protein Cas7/Csd2 [Verrucomicrobiota bacterium]MCH8528951.1 type I-C CRISPR-associated protein Cas7/Csd2 [Kiritimatiellia bacterium]